MMVHNPSGRHKSLQGRFPPSEPCTCSVCVAYCQRPGWWTVNEARRALAADFGNRMMLEMAPDFSFGVLSPAFIGCEGSYAVNERAQNGCNFLKQGRCELFGSGFEPLECRFCHHERAGLGPLCHAALEKDWRRPAGQALVQEWVRQNKLWDTFRLLQRS